MRRVVAFWAVTDEVFMSLTDDVEAESRSGCMGAQCLDATVRLGPRQDGGSAL